MDGESFDALVRRALGNSSRRAMVRVGFGALTASTLVLLGLPRIEEAAARKTRAQKQRARKRKARQKTAKQGPPGSSVPPVMCTGESPITCGARGCCSNDRPVCCDDQNETSGKSCHRDDYQCCPVSLGGGVVPARWTRSAARRTHSASGVSAPTRLTGGTVVGPTAVAHVPATSFAVRRN